MGHANLVRVTSALWTAVPILGMHGKHFREHDEHPNQKNRSPYSITVRNPHTKY